MRILVLLRREAQKTNNLEQRKVSMSEEKRSENWAHGLVGRGRQAEERYN